MPGIINTALAVIITLFFINVLRPIARRVGLVDHPGGRKSHEGLIPLIGGIAMFCGFAFALLTLPVSLAHYRSFLAASFLLVVIGVLDDFHELSPKHKFIAQIIAGVLITVWGKTVLHNLGNLFFLGSISLGILAIPISVIASLGIVNAVNFSDGLDGLAGTLALIQLSFFYLMSRYTHNLEDIKILLLLMGVVIAFLFFNFPWSFAKTWRQKNKIFMGDAGSMFLGLALVWFAIRLSQGTQPAATPVTMLWVMAVPLLDTFSAILRRLYEGNSPLHPDENHFHHVLRRAGCDPLEINFILGGLSVIAGMLGIAGYHYRIAEGTMFVAFVAMLIVTFFVFTDKSINYIKLHYLQLLKILSFVTCLIIIACSYYALHFGAPFFDEPSHLLPIYKFLLGQRPFIDEYGSLQLAALFVYPFYKLFYIFNHHSITGIFLFGRILYFFFALMGFALLYVFLRRSFRQDYAALIAINIISFVPFGLHSTYYNSLSLLSLTIGYFAFFHVAVNQDNKSLVRTSSLISGICLGIVATIYPPLCVGGILIFLFYFLYRLNDWKFYLLGLLIGGSWLVVLVLKIGVGIFFHSMTCLLISKAHSGLLSALMYYKSVLENTNYCLFALFFLFLFTKRIKNVCLNHVLLFLITATLLSIIFWPHNIAFGAGMAYTVSLFFLAPFLFLFGYQEVRALWLFKCIWLPGFLTWPLMAYVSGSQGYSSVVSLFPGALMGIAMLVIIGEIVITQLPVKKYAAVISLVWIYLFAIAYQYANLNYFYDDMPRAQLTSEFSQGALKGIKTTPYAYSFIVELENGLQALSGQGKTLTYLTLNEIGYFVGDFVPYVDVAYNEFTEQKTLNYYLEHKNLPEVAVKIKAYPGYWVPAESALDKAFLAKYYTMYADKTHFIIYKKNE